MSGHKPLLLIPGVSQQKLPQPKWTPEEVAFSHRFAGGVMADTNGKKTDLEAQAPLPRPLQQHGGDAGAAASSAQDAPEYWTSTSKKVSYLIVYFFCNISLTIYNKVILGQFHYPWLLTAIHAGSASIGCYILLLNRTFTLTKLSSHQNAILLAFSVLFTVNIAISNVSLAMVSIPFHQIMRSTCPAFTVLIYEFRYKRSYSSATYLSLVPLVIGAGLTTYGDYYFTLLGFCLTLLGVVLAAVKTVATNRIMTGPLALSPLETLLRMSPLACLQALLCSLFSGELSDFASVYFPGQPATADAAGAGAAGAWSWPKAMMMHASRAAAESTTTAAAGTPPPMEPRTLFLVLAGNGLLAFLLNVSSFSTNKHAGALTMTVCGNVKQCITVLLGVVLFGVKVGLLNGLGMAVALAGAAWYSAVELKSKMAAGRR